jgi:hypothetical protein
VAGWREDVSGRVEGGFEWQGGGRRWVTGWRALWLLWLSSSYSSFVWGLQWALTQHVLPAFGTELLDDSAEGGIDEWASGVAGAWAEL